MTYKEVCLFLDELWADNGLAICWGCFENNRYEHHHIVSRQECAKHGRPDLLTDPENLIPLCYNPIVLRARYAEVRRRNQ